MDQNYFAEFLLPRLIHLEGISMPWVVWLKQ